MKDMKEQSRPKKMVLRKRVLELFSLEVIRQTARRDLVKFLEDLGISINQSRVWQDPDSAVYMVMEYLAYNDKHKLFKLIEEIAHPLMWDGNSFGHKRAMEKYDRWLGYDGYELVNFRVRKKSKPAYKKASEKRNISEENSHESLHQVKIIPSISGVSKPSGPIPALQATINDFLIKRSIATIRKGLNLPQEVGSNPAVDSKWDDIEIQFLNGHEVIIKTKTQTYQTNFDAMGFRDKKRNLPNLQWKLLEALSKSDGEFNWTKRSDFPESERHRVKKQKQLLANALKLYFRINGDPFFPYHVVKAYKIKLRLRPMAEDNYRELG